jgi:hypothetical protein
MSSKVEQGRTIPLAEGAYWQGLQATPLVKVQATALA